MFSDLFSRVTSSFHSPKAILASKVASSLATYFDVSSDQIQSNLLTDTKIVLPDVRLKPQVLIKSDCGHDVVLVLVGHVRDITFSWKWGGSADGSTSFVKECILTISTPRFRIRKAIKDDVIETESYHEVSPSAEQGDAKSSETKTKDPGYLERHVQQIIDHLTLCITDFELTIETGTNDEELVLEVQSLQLKTLGGGGSSSQSSMSSEEPSPPLAQRISLDSVSAKIISCETKVATPVLEPFSYACDIQRKSGRRFLDGFATGLVIVGGTVSVDGQDSIRIHIETPQVKFLNQLLEGMILLSARKNEDVTSEDKLARNEPIPEAIKTSIPATTNNSTTCCLSLPSLIAYLPSDSQIQMPDSTLYYDMDGTRWQLVGKTGIFLNEKCPVLQVKNMSEWCIDFLKHEFVVKRNNCAHSGDEDDWFDANETERDGSIVACFNWYQEDMKRLLVGLLDLQQAAHSVVERGMEVYSEYSEGVVNPPNVAGNPWSLSINGCVQMRVQSLGDDWLEAAFRDPSVVFPADNSMTPQHFRMSSAVIGPTSFGDASIIATGIELASGSDECCVRDPVLVTAESLAVVERIQEFLAQQFESDAAELAADTSKDRRGLTELPLSLYIPEIKLTISAPKTIECIIDKIQVRKNLTIVCESFDCNDEASGLSTAVSGIVLYSSNMRVKLHEVKTLRVRNLVDLEEPVHNLSLCFEAGTFRVNTESRLNFNLSLSKQPTLPTDKAESFSQGLSVPFPILLRLGGLKMATSKTCHVTMQSIDVVVTPKDDSNELSVQTGKAMALLVENSNDEWLKSTIKPFQVTLSTSSDGSLFVGNIRSCGILIGPVSYGKLVADIPSFATQNEGKRLQIEGTVGITMQSTKVVDFVQTLVQNILGVKNNSPPSSTKDTGLSWIKPVTVPRFTVQITEQNVQIDVHCLRIDGVALRCESVSFLETGGNSISAINVNATLEPEVHIQVKTIQNINIPGGFSLVDPIDGMVLKYARSIVHVDIPLLSIAMAKSKDLSHSKGQTYSALPFSIHCRIKHLHVKPPSSSDVGIRLASIDLTAATVDKDVSIECNGVIKVKLEAVNPEEWLEMSVAAPSVVLSPSLDYSARFVKFESLHFGPSSHGQISVDIPSAETRGETNELRMSDIVEVTLRSQEVVNGIQRLLHRLFAFSNAQNNDTVDIYVPVFVPKVKIFMEEQEAEISLRNLGLKSTSLRCGFVRFANSSGVFAQLSGVTGDIGSVMLGEVEKIETVHVPGIFELTEPVAGSKVSFSDEALQIFCPKLSVTLLEAKTDPFGQTAKPMAPDGGSVCSFACPIHLQLQELIITTCPKTRASIKMWPIDMVVVPVDNSISVENTAVLEMRVASSEDDWIESRILGVSALLCDEGKSYDPIMVNCAGFHIGPSSCGHISADIPPIATSSDGKKIVLSGTVDAELQSVEVATHLKSLMYGFLGHLAFSGSQSDAITALLPRVALRLIENKAKITTEEIIVDGREFSCSRVTVSGGTGLAASLSGIKSSFEPSITAKIEWVETCYVPGMFSLEKPLPMTRITFVRSNLHVDMSRAHVTLLSQPTGQGNTGETSGDFEPPFPLQVCLGELILKTSQMDTSSTSLSQISINLQPAEIDLFDASSNHSTGPTFQVAVDNVDNRLMRVESILVSGELSRGSSDTIQKFTLSAKKTTVVAGFSSFDWKQLWDRDSSAPTELKLPYAWIDSFTAHLSYKGSVVGTSVTTVKIPKFRGGPTATSSDIIQHVTSAVLRKAPAMITNVQVMGENVVEMSAKGAGRLAMASSMAGSMAGSITGLVAVDGIKGAIQSGKKGRNAEEGDRYHFGDVTRGIVRSVKQASVKGAELRRGDENSYSAGDFSVGASHSMGKYVGENKSRLGAAGGSSVGMAIGTAVAGPLGFVVGGYLGSKAGGKAFEDGKAKTLEIPGETECNDSNTYAKAITTGSNHTSQHDRPQAAVVSSWQVEGTTMSSNEDVDLLGLDTSQDIQSSLTPGYLQHSATPVGDPMQQDTSFDTYSPAPYSGLSDNPMGLVSSEQGQLQSAGCSDTCHNRTRGSEVPSQNFLPQGAVPEGVPSAMSANEGFDLLGLGSLQSPKPASSRVLYKHVSPGGDPMCPSAVAKSQNSPTTTASASLPVSMAACTQSSLQSTRYRQVPRSEQIQDLVSSSDEYAHMHGYQHQAQLQTAAVEHYGQNFYAPSTQLPAVSHQRRQGPSVDMAQQMQQPQRQQHQIQKQKQGYRFGDATRSIIAKGKQSDGRTENDGYKFGDFTRGLFSKK